MFFIELNSIYRNVLIYLRRSATEAQLGLAFKGMSKTKFGFPSQFSSSFGPRSRLRWSSRSSSSSSFFWLKHRWWSEILSKRDPFEARTTFWANWRMEFPQVSRSRAHGPRGTGCGDQIVRALARSRPSLLQLLHELLPHTPLIPSVAYAPTSARSSLRIELP